MFVWKSTWDSMLWHEKKLMEKVDKLEAERDLYKRELEAIRDRAGKVLPDIKVTCCTNA